MNKRHMLQVVADYCEALTEWSWKNMALADMFNRGDKDVHYINVLHDRIADLDKRIAMLEGVYNVHKHEVRIYEIEV